MADPKGKLVTPVVFDPDGNPVALEVDAEGNLKVTGGDGVDTFKELTDTPNSYVDQAGKRVKVNVGEDALVFVALAPVNFLALDDTPANYIDQAGKRIAVNEGEDALEFVAPPDTDFLALDDTPEAYADQAGKRVAVNVGQNALEFVDPVAKTNAKARAYLSVEQTIATSTLTLVELDTESADPGNTFNTDTHRYVVAVAGWYAMEACIFYLSPGIVADQMILGLIYVNGAGVTTVYVHTVYTQHITANPLGFFHLDVDDYVELFTYHTQGGNVGLNPDEPNTHLAIHLLSAD